ncbi:TIGR02678 family protein [Catellatospora sp. NPDC049111]|uniref:TIGR02678 family protein n=1 Tax=Catellatospora sp. NPDC049111 TaxID=3155271 RepID=UPI0034099714
MSRFARDITEAELGDYQRAVRLVLRHPLITARWPDDKALRRVRRFSAQLRQDLADAFGYRLELHGATARLVRQKDQVDAAQPARTRTAKEFDRQRYAYLMLCLAVLGRAGGQITLSELAEAVAADAGRIAGLELDPDRGADRRAFVDAVAWLEERGALTVADGSAQSWASDPRAGEALYDVARDVVLALYRPTKMVQAVAGIADLLDRSAATSGNEERRIMAQSARRAAVERPVVYFADVDEAVGNHLRGTAFAEDIQRLTGLRLERRAEGVLLVDTVSGFSAERFPSTGSVAQVAVLLAVEMADRITDPDGRRVKRMDGPSIAERQVALTQLIDVGLPTASQVLLDEELREPDGDVPVPDSDDGRLPFVTDSFLLDATRRILTRHAGSFGAQWHGDPERLCAEAKALLERFGCVLAVPGGVLVLPLTGRYRNTTAASKARRSAPRLF